MALGEVADKLTWEQDYSDRVNPRMMTQLAHQAVPVLRWVGWEITKVEYGSCETRLPLSVESTNQHGTHQAALISLSADYTGGMALTSLLSGVPLSGIHHGRAEESASLWLADMNVRYLQPSTGHLRGVCHIDDKQRHRVTSRYFSGKTVLVTLRVEFWSEENELVAEADMRYFAQATKTLLKPSAKGVPSRLSQLKLKTSARIIAGVRSIADTNDAGMVQTMPDGSMIRIDRPHNRLAAGTHGTLQASRLQSVLPQLVTIVEARTAHCDQVLLGMNNVEQLVMLGAGLDMRPFRLHKHLADALVFELDLPVMLDERSTVVRRLRNAGISDKRFPVRYRIDTDFLSDDVGQLLREHPDFSDTARTMVIYEGCSMYFSHEQNVRLLSSIRSRLRHRASQIWMDCVSPEIIDGSSSDDNVREFLKRMELIGERFIYGPQDRSAMLNECGFICQSDLSAGEFLSNPDPTLNQYRFLVGKRDSISFD